jgi:FKBP-type peptidyl-prolyl cis-trans isomerase 2
MSIAKTGDRVQVHYVGRFTHGEVFDSSVERNEPIEFEIGAGMMIKGFDDAVNGMSLQETKIVMIPAAEAYGEHNPEHLITFGKDQVPEDMNPQVGDLLNLQDNMGRNIPVSVYEVTETTLVLDANHPMAGKDLVFEIELVAIL